MNCPECGSEVSVSNMEPGMLTTCPSCGIDLQMSLDYKLILFEIEGEDWGE